MAENTHTNETTTTPEPAPATTPTPEKEEAPPAAVATSATEMTSAEKPKNKMKFVTHLLSILAFLLSLPILALVIWLLYMREYDCEYLLKLHKLYCGIIASLIIMLVLNNVALFLSKKSRLRMPALILVMIPVIVVFVIGLGLVGGFKMESRNVPGSPQRLKSSIYNINTWSTVKSCLYDQRICQTLATRTSMIKSYDYTTRKLSPVQSGCCRPPGSCHMEYVNSTYWKKGDESDDINARNSDCNTWTNQETILCYNCNSCKEGFRRTIGRKWIVLGSLLVSVAILLFIVHLVLFLVSMSENYFG